MWNRRPLSFSIPWSVWQSAPAACIVDDQDVMVVAGANDAGHTPSIGPIRWSLGRSNCGGWGYLLRLVCLEPRAVAVEGLPWTDGFLLSQRLAIVVGAESSRQTLTGSRVLQVGSQQRHCWIQGSLRFSQANPKWNCFPVGRLDAEIMWWKKCTAVNSKQKQLTWMCAWCSQQEFVPETIPSCHQRIKDPSTKVGTTAKSVAPVADLGQDILVKQARAHVQRYFLGTDPMQANPPTTRFSCRPAISEMDKFPMDWVVFFARSTWSNCWAAGPCLYFRSWNSQWSHDFQRFSKKKICSFKVTKFSDWNILEQLLVKPNDLGFPTFLEPAMWLLFVINSTGGRLDLIWMEAKVQFPQETLRPALNLEWQPPFWDRKPSFKNHMVMGVNQKNPYSWRASLLLTWNSKSSKLSK